MKLRPYQQESIDAVNAHLRDRDDNPCIVLPTGAGKSLVIAKLAQQWIAKCPDFRIFILAHRKELVSQNSEELQGIAPELSIGVFAASLKRRETLHSVTFAAIQSVSKRASDFPPQDVIIVDEADMIPVRGDGTYRTFINAMKDRNPNLRVIGLTATPYRLGTGQVCHRDHILNKVCYEANIGDLIRDGYLSSIRTIEGDHSTLNLDKVKKTGSEFNLKDLAMRVDKADVVSQAVKDMVFHIRREQCKSVAVFGIDVEHCNHVKTELRKYGIDAPCVFGSTKIKERDRLTEEFKSGRIQYLISVDTLNVGFNAKCVDCVVMLRPTLSKRVWVQSVGRGLRLHPNKTNGCLILDYGDNVMRHGPIDLPDDTAIKLATCGECSNVFSRAVKCCPSCGWEIPPQQREMFAEADEKERKMHEAKANAGMLLNKPRMLDVNAVTLRLHRKAGKADSVRVEMHCGLTLVKHWLTLDHGGYGSSKARKWLHDCGLPAFDSVAEMLEKCEGADVAKLLKRVLVRYESKYLKVSAFETHKNGEPFLFS